MLDYRRDILPYLKVNDNGLPIDKQLYHAGYDISVKMAEEIAAVFGDEYPKFLNINRPKEKAAHKKYRAEIYRNVVSRFRTQATLMVGTIHQNDDYKVTFPETQKTDTLQQYTEEELFTNQTYTEWFFAEWTKAYIDDPNSIVAPYVNLNNINDTEYQKPKLKIVSSEGVIQSNDELCVLRGDELTYIKVGDKKQKVGRNLYFYDKESFVICRQLEKRSDKNNDTNYIWEIIGQNIATDEFGEVVAIIPFSHNYKKVPTYKVGRILGKKVDGETQIYRSEVSDALPHLKNILQRVSDSEIEFLQHIHTVNYYYVPEKSCNAVGCENGYITVFVEDPNVAPKKRTCEKCGGNGIMPVNALEDIVITIPKWGGIDGEKTSMNFAAPSGTIPRNIDTVRELRIEIDKQWYFAMATLNAQWMMEAPLNTSGKSKAYDRQEYTKREADIALHIKKQQTAHYNWTAAIRYGVGGKDVKDILPTINVPTDNFDIYTQEEALQEYSTAIEKGMNGVIVNGLAVAYSEKKFGGTSDTTKRLRLKNKIDPCISISGNNREEKLMLNLFNQVKVFGIDETEKLKQIIDDTYLSLNLDAIITKLVNSNNQFLNLKFEEQKEQIETELQNYLPSKISEDIFKSVKTEPLTDVENQQAIN